MPEFDPHDLATRHLESFRLVDSPSLGDTAVAVVNPDGTFIGSGGGGGSATAANQVLEIAALNEIATDTDHLDANLSTLATQATLAEIATDTDNLSTIVANQTNGTQHTLVDNFPATQPVSGTVTANQGTTPWVVGQTTGTNLHTVVDNFPATQPVSGTVTANAGTGTFQENLAQVAGTATSVNNGTADAGTIRVTMASDSAGQVKLAGDSSIANFQTSVTTSAAALASNAARSVALIADPLNTDNIFIGTSGVTSSNGFKLTPGTSISLDITNSNLVFAISGSGTQTLGALVTN